MYVPSTSRMQTRDPVFEWSKTIWKRYMGDDHESFDVLCCPRSILLSGHRE